MADERVTHEVKHY